MTTTRQRYDSTKVRLDKGTTRQRYDSTKVRRYRCRTPLLHAIQAQPILRYHYARTRKNLPPKLELSFSSFHPFKINFPPRTVADRRRTRRNLLKSRL